MEETYTSEPEPKQRLSPTWIAVVLVAVLVMAFLIFGLMAGPGQSLAVGSPVPDFELGAFDGSPVRLADYRGQVVVVNFYASWCSPCRTEAPAFRATWLDYRDRGVQFLGVAYKDAQSKAQAFLDEYGIDYPSALDPGSRTASAFGVTGVPETFVIDQQGNLVRHWLGEVNQVELQREIDPLLTP